MPGNKPSALHEQFTRILESSDTNVARLVVAADPDQLQRFISRAAVNLYLMHPERAEALLTELTTVMSDPLMRSLAHAPYDDEPLDEDDLAAIEEGLGDLERGRVIPDTELETWIEK